MNDKHETRVYREFTKILAKKVVGFAIWAVLILLLIGVSVGAMWLYTEAADLIIQMTAINDNPLAHMFVTGSLLLASFSTLVVVTRTWAEAKAEVGKGD